MSDKTIEDLGIDAVHDILRRVWSREISADEGFDEIQDLCDDPPEWIREDN